MPEQTYPPYSTGGTVVPRQLIRWIDINPQGGSIQRTRGYVVMPAFAIQALWQGFSDIVLAFNFECLNNFSIKDMQLGGTPTTGTASPVTSNTPAINVTLVQGGGLTGHGTPEGVQTANPGTPYLDLDSNYVWVKGTGTGNVGWVEVIG